MTTLAYLKQTVADDLHRSDLTNAISDAINSAIRHYRREDWWFLENIYTFTTSASQAYYSLPSGFKEVDSMMVTISGSKTPLTPWTYEQIDEEDMGITVGIPSVYAIYENKFRFYPVPNDAYVITLSQDTDLDAPSDSASNAWTSSGFDILRHRSVWDVSSHRLRNFDMASAAKASELDAYMSLMKEQTRKVSTGKFKKSWW